MTQPQRRDARPLLSPLADMRDPSCPVAIMPDGRGRRVETRRGRRARNRSSERSDPPSQQKRGERSGLDTKDKIHRGVAEFAKVSPLKGPSIPAQANGLG